MGTAIARLPIAEITAPEVLSVLRRIQLLAESVGQPHRGRRIEPVPLSFQAPINAPGQNLRELLAQLFFQVPVRLDRLHPEWDDEEPAPHRVRS